MTQHDNTTLQRKAALRVSLLKSLQASPVILETHGGLGRVWERVYADVPTGIAFEIDATKVDALARQRPTWSVYEGRAEGALQAGVGAHLEVNLIDVDPYGEPWPTIEAFFQSERPRVPRLGLVVNDGLRQKLRLQGGWSVRSLRQAVELWGNGPLYDKYLDVAKWKVQQLAARQSYRITSWTAYHCGDQNDMTHYAAILERAVRRAAGPRKAKRSKRRATPKAPAGQPGT